MAIASKKIKDNLVYYALYTVLGFILLSSVLSFWNRYVTYDTRAIIESTERVNSYVASIKEDLVLKTDLCVHAYASSGNRKWETFFFTMIKKRDSVFRFLRKELVSQNLKADGLDELELSVKAHLSNAQKIMQAISKNDSSNYLVPLKQFDFDFSDRYDPFASKILLQEKEIRAHAQSDYEWSIADNAIIQIILILLSVPILVIASRRLKAEIRNTRQLLTELEQNNRKYLYNDGSEIVIQAQTVVERSIVSFRKAFMFVENVSKGNFDSAQVLLPKNHHDMNRNTLMGALLDMSAKLQKAEEEDRRRQWAAKGINEFYEIVRANQEDLISLSDKVVSFLTKYLKSLQGSLFIVKKESDDEYLELASCYAYDRKKWMQKRIDVGSGLIGQTYLEGEPTLLTEIPNGYTSITSGLGDATPCCILIVPFISNEKTEAVFEVASFSKYEVYQVDFLKKAGEILAAALQAVKNNSEMRKLLQQSHEQAEMLKSQEEELRQNMEELAATNEAIRRGEN